MYEYRKLTPEQRRALVAERLDRGYPPHQPPHPLREDAIYLLTVTCYNHQPCLDLPERRDAVLNTLFEQFIEAGMPLLAWIVLPNHYHLLSHVHDFSQLGPLFRVMHGRFAFIWNREDACMGRKVWYRYSDRMIRSERHYYATLNYIHYNPVKHRYVESPYNWRWSGVHWDMEQKGQNWLREVWKGYPVQEYGKGWDDF